MKKIVLIILALAISHFGAAEPREKKGSTGMSPVSWGDGIAQFFSSKKSGKVKKDAAGTSSMSQLNNLPVQQGAEKKKEENAQNVIGPEKPAMPIVKNPVQKFSPVVKIPSISKRSSVPRVPRFPQTASSVATSSIRQEIQRILSINNQIKAAQSEKIGKLQQLTEKANDNEKILAEIKGKKGDEGEDKQSGQDNPNKESLLAQEKLRVINETAHEFDKATQTAQPKSEALTKEAVQAGQQRVETLKSEFPKATDPASPNSAS